MRTYRTCINALIRELRIGPGPMGKRSGRQAWGFSWGSIGVLLRFFWISFGISFGVFLGGDRD